MSVLQGIKGTFQSVQQDLVDGFKALTSFDSHPKSEVLKRLRGDGVNLDAGADLLYRYHLSWREIDSYSKETAKRAEGVDEEIDKIYKRWSKQDNLVHHLDQSVKQIPVLLQVLSNLTASIGDLEESFRIVEEDLEKLEDVCEEQEFLKQQQQQIHHVQQYRHQKSKEIEKVKVQMARDHAQRMIELEKERIFKLQERQEAFEEAFSSDLSYYKEHGKTGKLKLPEIPKVSSLSEINIDQDEKALNEFLSSQTTTPVADKTIDEENIDDDAIDMNVVVTSEESFIDDDYTKDYGHDINTVPDSDSSQDEDPNISENRDNSKKSGSKDEENSKESGNNVEDNSNKSGGMDKENSEESGNTVEDISKRSGSKTEDDSKQKDISKLSDENLSENKAEDNQNNIQDTSQQSSNEVIQIEDITNEDTPKQSDSNSKDNQVTDAEVSYDPGTCDKDIPQQSLSKDQNDNDSKVS